MVSMFKPKTSISNDDFIVVLTQVLTTHVHHQDIRTVFSQASHQLMGWVHLERVFISELEFNGWFLLPPD